MFAWRFRTLDCHTPLFTAFHCPAPAVLKHLDAIRTLEAQVHRSAENEKAAVAKLADLEEQETSRQRRFKLVQVWQRRCPRTTRPCVPLTNRAVCRACVNYVGVRLLWMCPFRCCDVVHCCHCVSPCQCVATVAPDVPPTPCELPPFPPTLLLSLQASFTKQKSELEGDLAATQRRLDDALAALKQQQQQASTPTAAPAPAPSPSPSPSPCARCQQLDSSLSDVTSQLQSANGKVAELSVALESNAVSSASALQAAQRRLDDAVEQHQRAATASASAHADLQVQLSAAQRDLSAANARVAELTAQLGSATASHAALQQQLDASVALANAVSSFVESAAEPAPAKDSEALQELQAALDVAQDRVAELTKQLAALRTERDGLRLQLLTRVAADGGDGDGGSTTASAVDGTAVGGTVLAPGVRSRGGPASTPASGLLSTPYSATGTPLPAFGSASGSGSGMGAALSPAPSTSRTLFDIESGEALPSTAGAVVKDKPQLSAMTRFSNDPFKFLKSREGVTAAYTLFVHFMVLYYYLTCRACGAPGLQ